uniref:CCHC-type domain-containing protein n=1 Tax=Salarias fasciatus TaxID=181472 RepID=A0A672HN17_SALFA
MQSFLLNVKPHIASVFKMTNRTWSSNPWDRNIEELLKLQREKAFAPPKRTAKQERNRGRKSGNCLACGREGHWAKQCTFPKADGGKSDDKGNESKKEQPPRKGKNA